MLLPYIMVRAHTNGFSSHHPSCQSRFQILHPPDGCFLLRSHLLSLKYMLSSSCLCFQRRKQFLPAISLFRSPLLALSLLSRVACLRASNETVLGERFAFGRLAWVYLTLESTPLEAATYGVVIGGTIVAHTRTFTLGLTFTRALALKLQKEQRESEHWLVFSASSFLALENGYYWQTHR